MSHTKSILIDASMELNNIVDIAGKFGVEVVLMDLGFKHLGFHLKPNNYGIKD